jgi:hypothetical protein
MAGKPIAEHHPGDVAIQLTDERVPQAEGLAAISGAARGKIDELGGSPGLSGKTGWRVARQHDQFGNAVTFALTRCAQNVLLTRSILGVHKGPERVSDKAAADEPVTPDGAAEDADLLWVVYCQTSMVIGSSMKPLNADNS